MSPGPFNQTRAKATSDCSAKAPTLIWSTESTVCDSARASATFCREETFITTAETGQQYYKACPHIYSIFPTTEPKDTTAINVRLIRAFWPAAQMQSKSVQMK